MAIPGLQIGRRVHYVLKDGTHCAADIIGIVDDEKGSVNLHVLIDLPNTNDPHVVPFLRAHNVQKSDYFLPETWHWIERVVPEYIKKRQVVPLHLVRQQREAVV